jgi:hypothetical protein
VRRTWLDHLPAALLLLALMAPLRLGFTDDGFIHVQYARNLMTRGEYSFNPGETSFGTTSPLWVLTLAAAARPFGGDDALIHASRVLSWVFAFAALVAIRRLLVASGASRRVAVLGMLAFAADAWFARWSALAMESSLATFAAAAMLLASLRAFDGRDASVRFGAAAALGALVRPELYLALPVFAVAALTVRPRPSRGWVIAGLAVAAALLAPWLGFAKWHIGSFLPNTAGAKSGGFVTDPAAFVAKFSPVVKIVGATQGVAVVAMLIDLAVSRRGAVVLARSFRFAALWMAALPAAYVAADIQILSRYLLLITPAVCVIGWRSLESLAGRLEPRRAALVPVLACAVAVTSNVAFYARVVLPPSRAFSEDLMGSMAGLARELREDSPPDAVVAAADIGYLAFYSQRRVLDLGGLVEPETARLRAAHDYEEIVERGLYFGVTGYPHVDYLVDRELVADRFDGRIVNGYRFEQVHTTRVRNLGIRKPGDYFYTLYRVHPVAP